MVNEQGWKFVGRVRGRNRLQLQEDESWIPVRDLYGPWGQVLPFAKS
jgi:hypothetical protein